MKKSQKDKWRVIFLAFSYFLYPPQHTKKQKRPPNCEKREEGGGGEKIPFLLDLKKINDAKHAEPPKPRKEALKMQKRGQRATY